MVDGEVEDGKVEDGEVHGEVEDGVVDGVVAGTMMRIGIGSAKILRRQLQTTPSLRRQLQTTPSLRRQLQRHFPGGRTCAGMRPGHGTTMGKGGTASPGGQAIPWVEVIRPRVHLPRRMPTKPLENSGRLLAGWRRIGWIPQAHLSVLDCVRKNRRSITCCIKCGSAMGKPC